MLLRRDEWLVLVVNLVYLFSLGTLALRRSNYEFVLYAGIVAVMPAIAAFSTTV